jgi:hypothetical protein
MGNSTFFLSIVSLLSKYNNIQIIIWFCLVGVSMSMTYTDPATGKLYNHMHGENLFHAICRLNIKCLMELIWKLAEKAFKSESKQYFLSQTMSNESGDKKRNVIDCNINAFGHLNSSEIFIVDELFNSTIDDLWNRKFKSNKKIDFSLDENFEISTTHYLLTIAGSLNLSEEEILNFKPEFPLVDYDVYARTFIFELNVNLSFAKILSADVEKTNNLIYSSVMQGIVSHENNKGIHIFKIFDFLKKKFTKFEYEYTVKFFFAYAFQSLFLNFFAFDLKLPENNAKVIYAILKTTLNHDKNKLCEYFRADKDIFASFFDPKVAHTTDSKFKHALYLYSSLLPLDEFESLLENQSWSVIRSIIQFKSVEIVRCMLEVLKSKIPYLHSFFLKVKILAISTISFNFQCVFDFCKENFTKTQLLEFYDHEHFRGSLALNTRTAFENFMIFFEEIFNYHDWKSLFFRLDKNNDTFLHTVLVNCKLDFVEAAIQAAKKQLTPKDYLELLQLKDGNKNSIIVLMRKRRNN